MISGSDLRIDAAENSFACSSRCGNALPRPILFSVAAKENGPPAAVVAATIFRVRFYSSLSQRKMVPPAAVVTAAIFRVRFYSPLPRRRMVPPATAVAATRSASDSNFRCREEEWFRLQTATTPPMHRFLISRPDLGITAGFCQETPSSVQ